MGVPVDDPQDRPRRRRGDRSRRRAAGPDRRRAHGLCRTRMTPSRGPRPPSRRRQEPPLAGPLPESLELVLGDGIYIAKERLPPGLRNRLLRLAAFQNPEFYKAQAMRLPTYGKPRVICCAEDHPQHIGLPRGCLEDVQKLLSDLHIKTVVRDERYRGHAVGRAVPGRIAAGARSGRPRDAGPRHGRSGGDDRLRQDRRGRVADRPARRQHAGARASPAVAGAMGRAIVDVPRLAAQGHRPHRRRPEEADRRRWTWRSCRAWCARASSSDCVAEYGHLIVDECHHLSAQSFEQVVRRAKAKIRHRACPPPSRARTAIIRSSSCSAARCAIASTPRRRRPPGPFEHTVLVRPTVFPPAASSQPGRAGPVPGPLSTN